MMHDDDDDQEMEAFPDRDNMMQGAPVGRVAFDPMSGNMPPAMPAMPAAGMGPSAAPSPGFDVMGGAQPVLMGPPMNYGAPAGRMPMDLGGGGMGVGGPVNRMPAMSMGPMAGPGMGPMRPTGNQFANSLRRLNQGAGQVGHQPMGMSGGPMGQPNRFLRAMRGR